MDPAGSGILMKNSKNNISDEKMLAIKDRAIELMMYALVIFDSRGKLAYANPAFLKMLGYGSIGEIQGRQVESFWKQEDSAAAIGKLIDKNGCWSGEVIIRKKDSSGIHVQISANLITDKTGRTVYAVYLFNDITKWMLAEKSLQKSKERYRLLADNVTDIIFTMDMNFQYTYVSPSAYRLLGYTVDEAMTMKVADVVTPETFNLLMGIFIEETEIDKRDDRDMARSRVVEYQHICKDGSKICVETTLTFLRDENNTAVGVLGIMRDISKRKLSEIALAESFERYRLLADNVTDVIFTMDMDFQYTYVSPSVHRLFGYTVGDAMTMKVADTVTPETFDLLGSVFVEEMEIEKRDDRDLTRSRVVEYQHISKDGSKIWAETTLTFLRDENNTAVGVLGIVRDISKRKQSEIALAESFERLRKTLDGTVQAISRAVETRDPYTAGHQRRVAELAVAIAEQMGMGDDINEGIGIAGSIHDIGKVAIPSEFLTKPGGNISNIEYNVIKEHSSTGYEILKSIEFPWPIAQIVYQHHERLDGSGYPRGLTDSEILMEAKIIAVADVVESMASNRPYRAAKGLNEALLEIKGKKGILYDKDVVDACLVVINEKGFKFISKSLLSDL